MLLRRYSVTAPRWTMDNAVAFISSRGGEKKKKHCIASCKKQTKIITSYSNLFFSHWLWESISWVGLAVSHHLAAAGARPLCPEVLGWGCSAGPPRYHPMVSIPSHSSQVLFPHHPHPFPMHSPHLLLVSLGFTVFIIYFHLWYGCPENVSVLSC